MNHVYESLNHTKWECKYHVAPAALFNRPLRGVAAMLSCRRENDHFTSMAHANEQG